MLLEAHVGMTILLAQTVNPTSETVIDSIIATRFGGNKEKTTYSYNNEGSLVQLLTEHWDGNHWVNQLWDGIEYASSERQTNTYDKNGKLLNIMYERWNNSQWWEYWQRIYTYDSIGNNIIRLDKEYNYNNNEWTDYRRNTYTYDSLGNKTGFMDESSDGSTLIISGRSIYTLDTNGNITVDLREGWKGSEWQNSKRKTYTYNYQDNVVSSLEEKWEGNQWLNEYRYYYSYDSTGYRISELKEYWSRGEWLSSQPFLYSYNFNSNGDVIQRMRLTSLGYNYSRFNYIYDSNNNNNFISYEKWDGSQWLANINELKIRHNSIGSYSIYAYSLNIYYASEVDEVNVQPTGYYLSQNYPNPFNPSTTISYSIPQRGFIQLKVYDILGREVVSLVNKEQEVGNYKIEFKASVLTSGVYFYRLQSGSFTMTKKLILLR